jgi:radical SAM superfamily enzyme YgiQ (UPF0313 family)
MRIAVIATYTHPTRLPVKEPSVMQSCVPELIAGLCPFDAQVEIYNEKEVHIPLDRDWDLVFFSYLHSYYEHTKALSAVLRARGVKTVAGGRHASYFADDVERYFDAVVLGDPEGNIPKVVEDFKAGRLEKRYALPSPGPQAIKPARYDLIDFTHNRIRLPGIEASRGCPFTCNFCVLTGHEKYRVRPIQDVVDEIRFKMIFNKHYFGAVDDTFIFLDNNLGGNPKHLRALCEALIPLKKNWGCAVTFNILLDSELLNLMARAGCRYIYTGLESLDPDALKAMNKGHNRLAEIQRALKEGFRQGIVLSFGLIVGSDGDTNEYLRRLPDYLSDLNHYSITFLGIVCPYPETPMFRTLQEAGRLLPNTISRDYDGYTLCHKPAKLTPSELVDHFQRLCRELGRVPNIFRHYAEVMPLSRMPGYKTAVLFSGPEITSIRAPVKNAARRYIAGLDPLEDWDLAVMRQHHLEPQRLS